MRRLQAKGRAAIAEDFGKARRPGRERGAAHGHRLDKLEAEAFVLTRIREAKSLGIERGEVGVFDPAEKPEPVPRSKLARERGKTGALVVATSGEHEVDIGQSRLGEGPHQERQVLARLPAAYVEDIRPSQLVPGPNPVALSLVDRLEE